MKDIIGVISEAKIREAILRGDFDNLPGKGKPIELQDLSFLPPELRAAYLVLKSAGYLKEDNCKKVIARPSSEGESVSESKAPSSKQQVQEKILRYNVTMDARRKI